MDALAAICEHPMFGLIIWVAIAVLNEMEAQWSIRTVAGLLVVKTYLSSTWDKKRGNNETNNNTTNVTVPPSGSSSI
jgi:hypothetical protein